MILSCFCIIYHENEFSGLLVCFIQICESLTSGPSHAIDITREVSGSEMLYTSL